MSNQETCTVRGFNSAKAKLQKAIKLLDEAADKFSVDSIRRKEIIINRQQVEETLERLLAI